MTESEARNLVADALKSGDYVQTKGCLEYNGKNCCLGVACRVFMVHHPSALETYVISQVKGLVFINTEDETDNSETVLPSIVQDWLGINSLGKFGFESLVKLNDSGTPFATIAELLRKDELWNRQKQEV